ncbi:hypothetical protein B1757_07440 [Acidithiobacillus marinus]|uniref:Uncharacterized protein n=1 Tax=Acidithiobacillus marinus TaxID=187490 RepID=A0A2I1DLP0_9PROT|nr:hypothetical protein [Acidithiobacillus marinus]PKY10784.1 hypothetical protein B1757_07440 [Acidithiobacillus marinus]
MNQYEQFLWDKTGNKYRVRVKKRLLSPYGCAWSCWSRSIILDSGYDTPDTHPQAWQACLLYNAGLARDREYNIAQLLTGVVVISGMLSIISSFLSAQTVSSVSGWVMISTIITQIWLQKRAKNRADQYALNHWGLADDYNHWKIIPMVHSIFRKASTL